MLKELSNRLRNLDLGEVSLQAIRDNAKELIELNQEQLFGGVDSLGQLLEPQYASASYARYKLQFNPFGVVDLHLTGSFYERFFVQADEFPIYIFSSDEKTRSLAGKYGTDIFGPDAENLDLVRQNTVLPKLQSALLNAIQL